jgi:hypothetical protein
MVDANDRKALGLVAVMVALSGAIVLSAAGFLGLAVRVFSLAAG